jgi:OOP family OmpA-OmpF porin
MIKNRTPWKALLLLAMIPLVGSCQTMPDSAFSEEQIGVMTRFGFREEGGNYSLGLNNRVLFAFDDATLSDETTVMLRELGSSLSGVGVRSATIEGHADAVGDADYNRALSLRRATAVMQGLVAGGMDSGSMRVHGLGADDPVSPNDTDEGRSQNRRVVIIVTPLDAISL